MKQRMYVCMSVLSDSPERETVGEASRTDSLDLLRRGVSSVILHVSPNMHARTLHLQRGERERNRRVEIRVFNETQVGNYQAVHTRVV